MKIFNLHKNSQKALQILLMIFHSVGDVVGKKQTIKRILINSVLRSE
jgi:hypothetical protein